MPWYALRSLKRANATHPDHKELAERGFQVFTPMHEVVISAATGRRHPVSRPVLPDLLFARAEKPALDRAVADMPTLQYRYQRGHRIDDPMTVRDDDMDRFIRAVTADSASPRYYAPGELPPDLLGATVRIIGGPLDGITARLLKIRGTRRRRILVELPALVAASVEVTPDLLEIVS